MLENLFQNQSLGPATSRGAIYSPAPARQRSPLEQFLESQAFGKQQAGNAAPTYSHLAAPGALSAPTFAPKQGAVPSLDPAAITNFYSDPAHADYHSDPSLLGIRAADNTTRDNADVAALGARRGLLAQLGDRGLGEKVLGPDDSTLGAISADPDKSTSVLARLARSFRDTTNQNEDALNKSNLFYSSERGRVLNSGAQDYSTGQADAIAQAQAQLDAISNQLASVKGGADSADQQAENDAFNRYMAAVAAHPPTAAPGGGSGAGTQPGGGSDPIGAALEAGADQQPVNDGYPVMPFQTTPTPGVPILPGIQQAFDASAAPDSYPVMPFTGPGTLDANAALAEYLNPKRKPVSGYSSTSDSNLH